MGMILRIASSRIVGQGDIVGRSGYFSLNLSANSVMRGRLDARRTLKSLVADLRFSAKERIFAEKRIIYGERKNGLFVYRKQKGRYRDFFFVFCIFSIAVSISVLLFFS